ncbi:MAG TPA: Cys-tRNA(Pro) deacylase [Myxococcota bacterium]|nr:Cys-tRNA(Pro) deacylase [Myxococcota bacterium]
MTPAIARAEAAGIEFSVHAFEGGSGRGFGARASEALGLPAERIFKTLVAKLDDARLVVAILPVASQLDLKRLAAAAGAKRAAMAPSREAERATGYVIGGISPLGQRQPLPTFLDESALGFATIYVSAGRRGLELELAPQALLDLCRGEAVRLSR